MTKTDTAPAKAPNPRIVALPDGALACRDCGLAVEQPRVKERIQTANWRNDLGNVPIEVKMTRCDECTLRHLHAEQIIAANPQLRRRLGSRTYAVGRVASVLVVLDVLGMPASHADGLLSTTTAALQAIEVLAARGGGLCWSSGTDVTKRADQGTIERWGHLADADRGLARDSYAAMLRERIQVPRPVPPPDSRGCMLCGVGHVITRRDAAEVWGEERSCDPAALGGTGPERVYGFLCPSCARSAEGSAGLGPTAMERALMDSLGIDNPRARHAELPGLKAWAALPEGTPPNAKRWAHVPDLDDLQRRLSWL